MTFRWLLAFMIIFVGNIFSQPIPDYLSINTDTETSRPKVFLFIKEALRNLAVIYQDEAILADIQNIFSYIPMKNFTEPDSWHTTCLYIGQNMSKLNTTIYKEFVEGVKVDIITSTFVYIPGKIISSPAFYDNFKLIENKFPHITLLLGSYRAVDSNYVLKSLFEDNENLKFLYERGLIKDKNFKLVQRLEDVEISFDDIGKKEIVKSVYIIKSGKVLSLPGLTKKNYSSK